MATFNPEVQQAQASNVQTRSPTPDTSIAELFQGLQQGGQAVLTGANAMIKDQIEKEVTGGYDVVSDKFTGRTPFEVLSGREPVRDYETNIRNLTAAYRSGAVSQAHYYLQLDNMSRQVRSRFPGHRMQVDQIVQNVTGINPANALATEIFRQTQVGTDAATTRMNTIASAAMTAGRPDIILGLRNGTMSPAQAEYLIAETHGVTRSQDAARRQLEIRQAQGQVNETEQERTAITGISRGGAVLMSTVQNSMGMSGEQFVGRIHELSTRAASGGDVSDEVNALVPVAQQFGSLYMNMVHNELAQPAYTQMGAAARKRIVDGAQEYVDSIRTALKDKDFGLLTLVQQQNERVLQGDISNITRNSSILRAYRALGKTLGDQSFGALMLSTQGSALRDAASNSIQDIIKLAGTGGPGETTTLYRSFQNLQGIRDPAQQSNQSRALLEQMKIVLSDKDAKPETVLTFLRNAFGSEPVNLVRFFNNQDSAERAYSILADPRVIQNLHTRFGQTQEYSNYRDFVNNNFQSINAQLVADFQNKVVESSTATITPDNTGRLVAYGQLAPSEQQMLDRFNTSLTAYRAFLSQDSTLSPELRDAVISQHLQRIGVDTNVTRTGGAFQNFWRRITDNFQRFGLNVPEQYQVSRNRARRTDEYLNPDAAAVAPVLNTISQFESGLHGYTSFPSQGGATSRDAHNPNLLGMTVEQVMGEQRELLNQQRGSGASNPKSHLGKYQFGREDLNDLVSNPSPEYERLRQRYGVSRDMVFDREGQDRLAMMKLQIIGLDSYLAGSMPESEFMRRLAGVWRGIGTDENDSTYNPGGGFNRAGRGSYAAMLRSLRAIRRPLNNQE